MPRPIRVQYAGAIDHVMSQGDRQDDIFLDDVDRKEFVATLASVCQKTGWRVHAYCLMHNHFHLVVETPEPNLVEGMSWLLSTCTLRLNRLGWTESDLATQRKNAPENSVSLEILYSDLFGNLQGKNFDYIFINPPYYPKKPQSMADNAWFCGENFEYFEKLFNQLPDVLAANNETFLILSEECAIDKIKAIALKNAMAFELIQEKKVVAETNYIFRIVNV